ncbi:MAG TPA: hypothetical protein PLA01_01465 [Acetivibrio sp.]|nr:hypothetical protein [Acetivibrio sp.]
MRCTLISILPRGLLIVGILLNLCLKIEEAIVTNRYKTVYLA